jgi:hypothetical protein
MSAGDKLLHSQIAPAKSEFELSGPRHQEKSSEAQQALSDWVKEENGKAQKGSRKPLTEAEIYQHAKEMLPQYRVTAAEDLEDMYEQARGIKEAKEAAKKEAKDGPKRPASAPASKTYNGYEYTKGDDGQWHRGRKVE